ncbi:MAG: type II toxin-antitoxin system PemK/MazF family toxin [Gloeomargaritaceae cyanobacterium C42_A2020_066]|nr:type II toxin-antitoxin system PemK/MazF family toxin [Gloeomargaritaceae cyanobacterium C42_A2020_066]
MTYEAMTVVRVPFPFTDRSTTKRRPAVVLSASQVFNVPAGHSVMAMITSASHRPWPLDHLIEDLATAGLSAPSRVRFKLFTLDHRLVQGTIGCLGSGDVLAVGQSLATLFRLTAMGQGMTDPG